MFRRLTDRISSAASSVLGSSDPNVATLTAMGFDEQAAVQALAATNGDVDRAAELLIAQGPFPPSQAMNNTEDEQLQRAVQESLDLEERRRAQRTAAMNKAAEAAEIRAATRSQTKPVRKQQQLTSTQTGVKVIPKVQTASSVPKKSGVRQQGLAETHPDVKVIPKLQDKSKEEQVVRCADRLKSSYAAVDTLHRALTAVFFDPDNPKFRKIDKTTAGYQRSVSNAPGAEDLLRAMNYRSHGPNALVLDRAMVDPALLYLGISALEQTRLTPEYKQAKQKAAFAKTVAEIRGSDDEQEAIQRSAFMSKLPTQHTDGRGALMSVVIADDVIRRRFDGDDMLQDILNWLGAQGSVIPDKILSREWSLIDTNRYPLTPIDCVANQHNTLQYIGCWPSGRLELVPSSEEWMSGSARDFHRGDSRGLGSAPSDAL